MRVSLQYLTILFLVSFGQPYNDFFSTSHTNKKTLNINYKVANEVLLSEDIAEGKVEFEGFKVRLVNYSYYRVIKRSGDTIRLETAIGEDLENKLLQIIPRDNSDKFKVYMTLERNLTVSLGEKQIEDLSDWKKFEDYKELRDSSDNYFKTIEFRTKEKRNELNKDFQKIKAKALGIKGEYMTNRLDSVTSLTYLPIELWVSRVVIEIIRTKPSGARVTYYIDAISPWGC